MKKIIFYLLLWGCPILNMQAQDMIPQLPNGNFENWVNSTTPQNWATNINGNIQTGLFPIPVNMAFGSRTTDAHQGSYALKLKPFNLNLWILNYNIPAICQLGTIENFSMPVETIMEIIDLLTNFDFENLDPSILEDLAVLQVLLSKGVPYPLLPSELSTWVKFLPDPESDDMAALLVYATRWRTDLNMREYVGFGYSVFIDPITEYTEIKLPIDTLLTETACDSISVMMIIGGQNTNINTEFYIDDITLSVYEEEGGGEERITEWIASNFKILSSENYITIETNEFHEYYEVQVFDLSGRLLFEKKHNLGNQTILTTHFQKGICFVKIKGKNLRSFSTQLLIK